MEVIVDRKRCEGYGFCEEAAPELFSLDAAGELVVRFAGPVPPELEREAVDAVRVCPVGALREELRR